MTLQFDCYKKTKASQSYQLLLINSYCSHIHLFFLIMPINIRSLFLFCLFIQLIVVNFWMLTYFFSKLNILKRDLRLFIKDQNFICMSKQSFYEFFKRVWEILFTLENIESAWQAIRIWFYYFEKILAIYYLPKLPPVLIKKTHI